MKKRIFCMVLVLCMILTIFPGAELFAYADATPQLVVSTESAQAGEEVILSVSTVNNPGVGVLTLGINYDSTKLEYIGFENSGFTGWTVKNNAVWVGDSDSDYNGEILKLKFKVLEGANGKAEVSVSCGSGDAYNYNEEPISFETISGGVIIEEETTLTPQLVVSTESAQVGEEVILSVSTVNNPGVGVLTLGINYDSTKLEYIGFENSGFTGWTVKNNAVWVGDNDSDYNGEILKLKFKVLEGANGKAEVSVSCGSGDAYNYNEEPISFETISGGVIIKEGHVHSYTAKVTNPTCTTKGYTTYTCECGESYVDNYTDALGHNYGNAVFTWNNHSCKATFTCARCADNQTFDCTVTSAVTKAATCTDTGIMTYTACVVFEGTTYTEDKEETIAALDHNLVHHDGKASTCTTAGWEAYDTCTRCDYTTYKEIPAKGHSYTTKVTAPTCTTKGYTTYTCECGDSYVDNYTDALGHDYGNAVFTWNNHSCKATFTCSRCADKQTFDCTVTSAVTKAATCTDTGIKTYTACVVFEGTTYTEDKEETIAALDHNLVHHDGKAATCTEAGWEAYDTCARCDYTTYKEIPATGHSYTATVTAATTKAMGYTTYTCSVCGDSYKANYTLAAPTISISRSSGKPKISWSAIGGATKYYIYRSTDGKTYKYLTSTTKTSCTNTKASSGKKYYYKVKAVAVVDDKNIYSAYSNVKYMVTTLTAPTLSKTTSSGHPKISWKAVTGADKYIVYYSTDGKSYSKLVTTTKLSVTHTKAKAGKTYYYKVKAVSNQSSNATSAYSKAVSIKAK